MAKLVKESSGYWTTQNGTRAVFMLRSVPTAEEGFRAFRFRNTPLQPVITIEWPDSIGGEPNSIALLPSPVADCVLNHGYARHPRDREIEAWNAAWSPPAVPQAPASAASAPPPAVSMPAPPASSEPTPPPAKPTQIAQDGQEPVSGTNTTPEPQIPVGDAPAAPSAPPTTAQTDAGTPSTSKPPAPRAAKSGGKK